MKKGISPLIATVLLIGFTVALVFIVTTWGTGYLKDILSGTEKSTSMALRCSPPYLDFDAQVDCETSKVRIMNRGVEDIVKLKILIGEDLRDVEEISVKEPLVSGNVNFQSFAEGTEKLEIITYIRGEDAETPIPCAQSTREVLIDCEIA